MQGSKGTQAGYVWVSDLDLGQSRSDVRYHIDCLLNFFSLPRSTSTWSDERERYLEMQMILHDMNDGECRTMLAQCSSFENLQEVAHLTQVEREQQRRQLLQQEKAILLKKNEHALATAPPEETLSREVKVHPRVVKTLRRDGELHGKKLLHQKEGAEQDNRSLKKDGSSMYKHSNLGATKIHPY